MSRTSKLTTNQLTPMPTEPEPTIDADKHEAVWGLGAEAGRSSNDLDGSFLAAIERYGKRVFPATVAREDAVWFQMYFQAFREGFESQSRPTPEPAAFLAWTNAPAAYDYSYVEDTVINAGRDNMFRLVRVTDRKRWDACQVPRYASGLHVAFDANCQESCAAAGVPCVDGGAA